jgi:hypothetical protein
MNEGQAEETHDQIGVPGLMQQGVMPVGGAPAATQSSL